VHEYSIVAALLERAEAEAQRLEASAVSRLTVAIGELSGVETGLLRSAFELARVGTPCAGAELSLRTVEPLWSCRGCEREIRAGGILRCPECGSPARLVAGDEIVLESLELEVA